MLLGLKLVYSLWLWRSLRNNFHGPPAVGSPRWSFIVLPIPKLILAISWQKFSLTSDSHHTTPARRNFIEELSGKWVRNKVGARLRVPCSPFLSHCICLFSTCRLRRDYSFAADGHPEILWKLTLTTYCLLSAAFGLGSAGTQEPSKPTGHHEICTSASKLLLCSSCSMNLPLPESTGLLLDVSHVGRKCPNSRWRNVGIPDITQEYPCKKSKGQKILTFKLMPTCPGTTCCFQPLHRWRHPTAAAWGMGGHARGRDMKNHRQCKGPIFARPRSTSSSGAAAIGEDLHEPVSGLAFFFPWSCWSPFGILKATSWCYTY